MKTAMRRDSADILGKRMGADVDWVFGEFRLDTAERRLWQGTAVVPLRPKLLAVLQYLVEHAGRLIPREELLRAVWSRTHVDETLLRGTMRDLRAALGDNADAPQFIETVPHQGYRFLKAVQRVAAHGAAVAPSTPVAARDQSLIEREHERTQLNACLDRALRRQRQLVFVSGEPGIGKTTLIDAFADAIPNRHGVMVGRGQCIEQYGGSEAYLPVLEALGQLCRQRAGKRVLAILNQFAPTWLVQLPALLSTGELDGLQRKTQGAGRDRMLREMAEALEALSIEMPIALIFEDLHWSDHSTLDLLGVLARRREPARLLLLGSYRPADVIVSGHPLRVLTQELRGRGLCEELALGFLTEQAVVEYLAQRFGVARDAPVARSLAQSIYQRTDGNPLFMINVVDDLIARGVVATHNGHWQISADNHHGNVPEGLIPLIVRQFERASRDDQRLLEAASVAGRVFSTAAVANLLDESPNMIEERCESLARRGEFLEELRGSDAGQYFFRHDLYRQALYEQLSASRRQRLHSALAALEAQGPPDQVRDRAAQLAVHFERGGDIRAAISHLIQAANNALSRRVFQESIQLLQHASALLISLPAASSRDELELRAQMLLSQAFVMAKGSAAPEVAAAVTRAHELSLQLDQNVSRLPALLVMARLHLVRAELREAAALGEQIAVQSLTAADPLPLIADGVVTLISCFQGQLAVARSHAERVEAAYDFARHRSIALAYSDDPNVMCQGLGAFALWGLGFADQANNKAAAGIALARRLEIPYCESMALFWSCWVHLLQRDVAAAAADLDALDAVATRHDVQQFVSERSAARGWLALQQGVATFDVAVRMLEQGLSQQSLTGTQVFRPWFMSSLAAALAGCGQPERARAIASDAVTISRSTGDLLGLMQALTVEGDLHAAESRDEAAAECYDSAMAFARRQAAKTLELRAAMRLARLRQRQGKVAAARTILGDVFEWFTEGFKTPDLRDARALLDSLGEPAPRGKRR